MVFNFLKFSNFKDMYPKTLLGKIIASFCAVIGIMMLALPLGVISTNFNAFEKYSIRFQKILESHKNSIDKKSILIEKKPNSTDKHKKVGLTL